MRIAGALAACGLVVTLAGCASGHRPSAMAGEPRPSTDPSLRLVASGLVLDAGNGPELCVGTVLNSNPPQCGGPVIDDWSWPDHGVERNGRYTWGDFRLVGTYDGETFRFQRLATRAEVSAARRAAPATSFVDPCALSQGGRLATDPRRATEATLARATSLAYELPGYADSFVDDGGDPTAAPSSLVLQVRVTGDVEAARARLAKVWGGALCVTGAKLALDLREVQDVVTRASGYLGGDANEMYVEAGFVYDDGSLQRAFDRRFGTGVVRVSSVLHPYAGG